MNQQIVFKGKTYNSIEEMPPEIRAVYETIMNVMADKNQNGMPDILEGISTTNIQTSQTSIIFNGQVYNSLDELPAEARTKYDQAMGKLDANHNGVMDMLEGLTGDQPGARAASSLSASEPAFSSPIAIPASPSSSIEPQGANWRLILIGAALIGFLCLGVIIVLILFAH